VVWNWYLLDQRAQTDSQRRFALDVEALGEQLQARMRAYEMVLRGISGTFASHKGQVSLAQWREVIAQMRVQELYPGISSVAWSRALRAEQLDTFMARVRADGRPDFKVYPEGARGHYQPIEYIDPTSTQTNTVPGLDILALKSQSQAITQAVDSGLAVLSRPLADLYTATPMPTRRNSAILFFPVYQTSRPPETREQRRTRFMGMMSAAFRGEELAEEVFSAVLPLLQIEVYDLETNAPLLDTGLLREQHAPRDWQPQFKTHLDIPLYGRTWRLNITGTPEYEQGLLVRNHNLVLATGLSLAVLTGILAGGVIHHRNRQIHASEQVAEQLRQQSVQLMLANRYKSEFLANMSHELRTPLNSILILSDQLRQNPTGHLTEKQARHADIIHHAASDLLQLINDVLDLAKIEAGRMQPNMGPVNLQDVLNDLDAAMRPQAKARKLHLYIPPITPKAGVPTHVCTDRLRLHQILRNLLSNAIKFTHEGQVHLAVNADPLPGDDRVMIHLAICDTGIGIAPEHHEQVFAAFQQLDGSPPLCSGGSGLGLAITRQLVRALGGSIELASAPGRGSTFTVHLPMQSVPGARAPARWPRGMKSEPGHQSLPTGTGIDLRSPILQGSRLLLVDDDIRSIYAMSALLDDLGLELITAHHGEHAIACFQQEIPDLILMDMAMPVMDGYTATKCLKTEHGCTVPIIALSAHAMKGDREKCLAAGADDYLAKPVQREELRAALERWLTATQTTIGH